MRNLIKAIPCSSTHSDEYFNFISSSKIRRTSDPDAQKFSESNQQTNFSTMPIYARNHASFEKALDQFHPLNFSRGTFTKSSRRKLPEKLWVKFLLLNSNLESGRFYIKICVRKILLNFIDHDYYLTQPDEFRSKSLPRRRTIDHFPVLIDSCSQIEDFGTYYTLNPTQNFKPLTRNLTWSPKYESVSDILQDSLPSSSYQSKRASISAFPERFSKYEFLTYFLKIWR